MKTHTAVALDAATGRSIGEKTVACTDTGHDELLAWARRLDPPRGVPPRGTLVGRRPCAETLGATRARAGRSPISLSDAVSSRGNRDTD